MGVESKPFMKLLNLLFKRETAAPILALSFASIVNVALVIARIVLTGNIMYGFLIWNTFLAWLPLIFSLMACEQYQTGRTRGWRFVSFVAAWLLFFPNAPYIFTDLIHLTTRFYAHFWVDMVLILMCAFTGLVIGFLSLYLMQDMVSRIWGRVASWVFIACATGLCSFGIFLGRFLRFNSWDPIVNPGRLYHEIGIWSSNQGYHSASLSFFLLFATFLFTTYVMLYALTHLAPAVQGPSRASQPV
jgi:uncharacterized membrane protein